MKRVTLLFLILLGLDAASKMAAIQWIPSLNGSSYPFGGVPCFSLGGITFSLNYIVNTGVAWGLLAGFGGWLTLLRVLIIGSLFFWIPKRWPVALIAAGAVGNVLDYCLYGHVIDFLHFTFWGYSFPVFNVADSCITIGVGLLLLLPDAKLAKAS